eukprot:gene27548-36343_t
MNQNHYVDADIKRTNVIVGLNPALQRIIQLSSSNLEPGEVHRASNVQIGIGGKGQNALIASNCIGNGNKFELLQFIGTGFEGDTVLQLLKSNLSCEKANAIKNYDMTVRSLSPCRTCITLVSEKSTTEIIEPSGKIEEEEMVALLGKVSSVGKVGGLAIMGSMPPGCPDSTYPSIVSVACDRGSRVLIDTMTNVAAVLESCVTAECEYVVLKVNARELCKLAKIPEGASGAAVSPDTLRIAADTLLATKASLVIGSSATRIYIATTDGPFPAFLYSVASGASWAIPLPALPFQVKNPIGAGDAVSAGTINFLCGLVQGHHGSDSGSGVGDDWVRAAFCWGLSCGAASCGSESNSIFDASEALGSFISSDTARQRQLSYAIHPSSS